MRSRATKIIYVSVAIILIGVFLALLYQPVQESFHTQDLWWMIPLMSSITEGQSFLQNLKMFLFDPYPTQQGDPWMNTYLLSVISVFGYQAKNFIFVLIAFHLICAYLLYSFLRRLDMDFRIAFFSALTYLTMFIHFDYYIWPMSSHHLFVLFFSLLVLNLYFETNKRIDGKRDWRWAFWLTICANFLATFCQITIFLLPLGILTHILISSKSSADRLKKYDMWLPLFITYLGYPVIRFVYVGYIHLGRFLHLNEGGSGNIALFPVIFLSGLAALFLFRAVLQLSSRYDMRKILKRLCIAGAALYLVAFIAVCCRHDLVTPSKVPLYQSLSPYNLIRPFETMLVDFISPIKAAFSVSSTTAYYVIPSQGNIFFGLAALFLLILFAWKYLSRYKGLVVFVIFYIVALRYMRITTTPLYSRHFLYVTPLFAVIFCSVFIYLYDLISNKAKLKNIAREMILAAIFIMLCVPNVFAIRLELARGRMANTFEIYDYIRIANIIKSDIGPSVSAGQIKGSDVFIDGIEPMPLDQVSFPSARYHDRLRFDPFRYVFAQALDDKSMINVNINQSADSEGKSIYEIIDSKVYASNDLNIDKFDSYFEEAMKELRSGNSEKAHILFKNAIETRPFLINYILAKRGLKDLPYITGGSDLKVWLGDIIDYYNFANSGTIEKTSYIASVMQEEIDEYIKCLFYKAYLDMIFRKDMDSEDALAQIWLLNSDSNAALSLLRVEPMVLSNKRMLDFLNNIHRGSR